MMLKEPYIYVTEEMLKQAVYIPEWAKPRLTILHYKEQNDEETTEDNRHNAESSR